MYIMDVGKKLARVRQKRYIWTTFYARVKGIASTYFRIVSIDYTRARDK